MSGIYIHIPYCKTRCTYCDFYTQTNIKSIDDYVTCICQELELQKGYFAKDEKVKTIYFGGGTPSLLNQVHLERIFDAIYKNFELDLSEVTLEANPDDITIDYLKGLKNTPINRISIGVQTFDDLQLLSINRRHSAKKALESIKDIQDVGFSNISIDLIYGLPQQTLEQWESNLKNVISLNIPHVSAYHLIYEPNTKMYTDRKRGLIKEIPEELSVDMYQMLIKVLSEFGYEHYEISNFAMNQMYAQHNTSYWMNIKYLGIGVAAHSYNGKNRSFNPPSLKNYIEHVARGVLCPEVEILNLNEKYNEFVYTRLRTMWGVNRIELRNLFGDKYLEYFNLMIDKYVKSSSVDLRGDNFIITDRNMIISDEIMSDLMYLS